MHVLSVGSSVIDLFLTADTDFFKSEGGRVSFNLGDKVPTDIKRFGVGGNGANVALGLTRLEIPTTFYTYLGTDALSREIENSLSGEGIEVVAHADKNDTPPLSLIFDFENDRIIFSHHQKKHYDFSYQKETQFDYIYLTSIGETWDDAYKKVLAYSKEKNIPLAFSPGSSQLDNFNETAKEIVSASKIYFSNKEEAEIVTGRTRGSGKISDLISEIKAMGPEIVSITDADRGAYAGDKEGKVYKIGTLPDEGNEKTGAGDAYAGAFFAAILHDKDVPEAMLWGTLNAHSVMREVGAQNGLLTMEKLDKMLSESSLKAESL